MVEDLIIEIKYFDTNYNPEIICYPIDKYGRERPKNVTVFSFKLYTLLYTLLYLFLFSTIMN